MACLVALVDPELIELVRRGAFGSSQILPALCFTEFGAIRFCDQREGQSIGGAIIQASGQIHTGDDVAPLVATANLKTAAVFPVEVQEVVGLQQAVGEFGIGDTVVRDLPGAGVPIRG